MTIRLHIDFFNVLKSTLHFADCDSKKKKECWKFLFVACFALFQSMHLGIILSPVLINVKIRNGTLSHACDDEKDT